MQALVVDDDRVLADLVAFTLRHEGFQVSLAYDGQSALQKWRDEQPDLIVLDLNLPKVDGFTVCRRIRAEADTPIIMLTVRGEEDDIVRGLELGADDYIPKPFSPRQLVARVKAVLRRSGKTHLPAVHQAGELTLDANRRELRIGQARTGAPKVVTGTCCANWSAACAVKLSLIRPSLPTLKMCPDLVMDWFYLRIAA
jgi:DNA-binding response OmpR family regulator